VQKAVHNKAQAGSCINIFSYAVLLQEDRAFPAGIQAAQKNQLQ
jgi:hypothetical protein